MGRGIIGKSKGDVAMDKMIKFMEKSDRQAQKHGPSNKPKEDPIISQLKQLYPDSWQDELDEMRLEAKNPAYLQAKNEFKLVAAKAYYNQTRMARDEAGLTENQYVLRQLRLWKAENRARFTKK